MAAMAQGPQLPQLPPLILPGYSLPLRIIVGPVVVLLSSQAFISGR